MKCYTGPKVNQTFSGGYVRPTTSKNLMGTEERKKEQESFEERLRGLKKIIRDWIRRTRRGRGLGGTRGGENG